MKKVWEEFCVIYIPKGPLWLEKVNPVQCREVSDPSKNFHLTLGSGWIWDIAYCKGAHKGSTIFCSMWLCSMSKDPQVLFSAQPVWLSSLAFSPHHVQFFAMAVAEEWHSCLFLGTILLRNLVALCPSPPTHTWAGASDSRVSRRPRKALFAMQG